MEKTSSQESVNAPPGKATLKMLKGNRLRMITLQLDYRRRYLHDQ